MALDAAGNLYIADRLNNRIRKVTPAGIISTVAGNGVANYAGDGGPALSAAVSEPNGIALDAAGNLYISCNGAVRKVTPAGIISTVAGTGATGFSGDGGPSVASKLGLTTGVALDAMGNMYIADQGNFRIRKVTPVGIISTVAGNGTTGSAGDGGQAIAASLDYIWGVTLDASGNLYIATFASMDKGSRIRKVAPAGFISTVSGGGRRYPGDGGPATDAFMYATSLAVDRSGNLYISEWSSNRVLQLVPSSPITAGCVYSIDVDQQSFGVAGGSGTVGVLANQVGCPWLAGSYVDWITLTSGNGVVTYFVAPNGTSTDRTGRLWIAQKFFKVTQPGLPCSYTINPPSVSVPSSGIIGSVVSVTASASDCQWSASSSVGWIFVSSGTSGTGSGAVTYTVGNNSGAFRSASITIAGQTFTVNQIPAGGVLPVISAGGVVNAATSLGGVIAPGEFVSIYGVGLGPTQGVPSKSMERGLGNTRVFFNGIEAFLTYASAGQVNALVPYGVASGERADVQVEYQAIKCNSVSLPVAKAAPGIFTQQYGSGQAWVVNQDQTFNSDKNPAARGTYLAFWTTGQGSVDPSGKDGEAIVAPNFPRPQLPVKVTVGGVDAEVAFAGLIYTGVMQVNVKVPDKAPLGSVVELLLKVGDFTSRSGVTLAVQ